MTTTQATPLDGDLGRVPPHDIAAEQGVLGGMLLHRDAIADVTTIIGPADHYRPAHQMIHKAITALDGRGEPADAVTVGNLLAERGELARAGGGPYLHTLISSVDSWAFAASHARIVRRHAVRRRAIEKGTRIIQMGYTASLDEEELADLARAEVDTILPPAPGGGTQDLDELLVEVLTSLEREEQRGVPTPWSDLNRRISGLGRGEVIVIAGRPGTGKSIAGLQIASLTAVHREEMAVIFSMEMKRHEIMMRLICAEGRVPYQSLMGRHLTGENWAQVDAARQRIQGAPLVIDDTTVCTLAHIRSRLREISRTQAPAVVVVDYLQLLTGPGRAENRQTEVAAFSRGLKLLAGEFDVPVVAISQLNRMPAMRSDRRPELSDLRESGAIEGDASVVVLLHREDASGQETPRAGEVDFIVAKNRNGPPGISTELFQGHFMRIVDAAPEWTPSSALGGQQ